MARIAMKVYDLQWFTTFGMHYDEAAAALREDGVDLVLTQNRIDPLPSSGVDQAGYLARYAERIQSYEDAAWIDALRRAGLGVEQTTATFFAPEALAIFPDARPVNADGEPDRGFDWYVGICPTHDGYLAWKIDRLRRVVDELTPDGLFLQFTRFPGFWENWIPRYRISNADRFCFCDRCRLRFAADEGIVLPDGGVPVQATKILTEHGEAWTRWRCRRVLEAIKRIAEGVGADRRGLRIMLNTLPFPASDFDGMNVRREIAAQDLSLLAKRVDRFELMTYLQILARPADWIKTVVTDARRQLPADREVVCTLQVAPLYTDGMHEGRGRSRSISADELVLAATTALDAGADGLVFYHWTDFLEDEAQGGRKRAVLREIARG
ncbi:MAG: hypothetical protein QOF33_3318 [Thermomicrobiales bacterium]|nr:hypothetical protein [Thermomicrobiales bacterium]